MCNPMLIETGGIGAGQDLRSTTNPIFQRLFKYLAARPFYHKAAVNRLRSVAYGT
jgi:hypothetical protein